MSDRVIRAARVLFRDGERPAAILIRDGRIHAVGTHHDFTGIDAIDAGSLLVSPGVVDTHVHINEPGRTDWEGFTTATRAAAAGGVTTLIDMPLNSIPATTTASALAAKRSAAAGKVHVDVGFWGGVVPRNEGELRGLAGAGVRGFKCFLSPSGVDEFENVSEQDLRAAMPVLAELGLPLLVHAELPSRLKSPAAGANPRAYATWLDSRPPEAEHAAIELMLSLAREYGAYVHIVHLASAGAVPMLAAARAGGARVTVETCPHYLTFCAEEIGDGATALKCAPPIRDRDHRDRLWKALSDGIIDLVATDHSPAPPSIKGLADGNFLTAWGGIASLQLSLAAVWTAMHERRIAIHRLTRWLCEAPARLARLTGVKGAIAPGYDADLVFWNPDEDFVVDATRLYHRHPVTPYDGARLKGRVMKTMLRGELVFDLFQRGEFTAARGRLL